MTHHLEGLIEEPAPVGSLAQSITSEPHLDFSVLPSYEESIFQSEQPQNIRESFSWGTESKPSFPPSVTFGDLDDRATRRPLPTPRPLSPSWLVSDEKAPFYEPTTASAEEEPILTDEELDVDTQVPARLSHFGASLETPSSVAIYQVYPV